MTTRNEIKRSSARDQARDEWLEVTPGELLTIRVSAAQTMGDYSIMEVAADPHNGVPLHIHDREDEHFIVLDGTLDIAVGNRRWTSPPARAPSQEEASLMLGAIRRIRRCACW